MWIESANKKIVADVTSVYVSGNKLKATELANSTDDIELGEYKDESEALKVKDYIIKLIIQGSNFIETPTQEEVDEKMSIYDYLPTDEDLRINEDTEIPI
ncbi:MAG: hypothetical protein AB6733_12300 [Clostridiaceae bacterium]